MRKLVLALAISFLILFSIVLADEIKRTVASLKRMTII
jgi:hypothetical protein